ncbi:MAG: DUF3365 domain-containing protein [Campylobacterota bacterium]|nr:DUF3365 domain-containing protein [Campylobacterota bacterium]
MNNTLLLIPNKTIRKYIIITILLWTTIVAISLIWNIYSNMNKTKELATLEARALFNKDKAFRFWGSMHGGVYVPKTEKTPSNPFLIHITDRDIVTSSGKELTLMNPAYMVRQMMEEYETLYGVRGHITSTIHFRPETAPDSWERKALGRFEKGEKEVVEYSSIDGKQYLRLMQPLYANKGCLKCHGAQGYKEGELRGGVSLSLPIEQHLITERNSIINLIVTHLLFWLLAIVVIIIYGKRLAMMTNKLIEQQDNLKETVAKRTSELNKTNEDLINTNEKIEKFNQILVVRETRIIEAKQEVNDLCKELGKEARYKEIEEILE